VIKVLFLIGMCAPGTLAATIQFTALPSDTEYGTYNGYVAATIDGQFNQPLICDDFDHTTYVPSGPLKFNESALAGASPLEYARFSGLMQYEAAAFLLSGLNSNPGATADYQYALWHLFTPSVRLPDSRAQGLLDTAAADVALGGSSASDLYLRLQIYTPAQAYGSNQEFLRLAEAQNTAASIPEPAGAVMMAVGLGLIAAGIGLKYAIARKSERTTADETLEGGL
jgi:hypothetical protein